MRHQDLPDLFDAMPVGVWVVDEWHRTEYLTPRMAELLGCAAAQMVGIPIIDCVLDERREEARRFLQGGTGTADLGFRRDNGSVLWALVSIAPQSKERPDTTSLVCFASDITA